MREYKGFEAIIGIEVHAELLSATKIFCSCKNEFAAAPNTNICPVCMGHPGTLPRLNRRAAELAVRAGLALDCEISHTVFADRKNYFYPDLPKAYQISQFECPIAQNGFVKISESANKRIGIKEIHFEEDAGKLIHENGQTLIDYNRCGVPLIEIVSHPDMRSADEAIEYVKNLRLALLYAGVCDCKMQEGSLRCDVNLSVRKIGETALGTRAELKNLNSFTFMKNAIEYEFKRQVDAILSGETLVAQTRRYSESDKKTYAMRPKEAPAHYRFFTEPDIPAFSVSHADIEKQKELLGVRPSELLLKYEALGLSKDECNTIIDNPSICKYFEKLIPFCNNPRSAASFLLGHVVKKCVCDGVFGCGIDPRRFACAVNMFDDKKISSSTAKNLLSRLIDSDFDPEKAANDEELFQISDESVLYPLVKEAYEASADAVLKYKNGKANALQSIVGKVMGKTAGKADPEVATKILLLMIEKDQ